MSIMMDDGLELFTSLTSISFILAGWSHTLENRETGEKNSLLGKIREFEVLLKIREFKKILSL